MAITLEQFMAALSGQESGGDYSARNGRTGAYGRFQIMPSNWPSWSAEAGLAGAEPTPENQDRVAAFKLQQYYDKFGNWEDVASTWYSGSPLSAYNDYQRTRKQGHGNEPSIQEYVDGIMSKISDEPLNARGSYGDIEFMGGGDTHNQEGIDSISPLPGSLNSVGDIIKTGTSIAKAAAQKKAADAKIKPIKDARDRVATQIQDYLSRGESPPPALVNQLREFDITMDAVTSGIWGEESGSGAQDESQLLNALANIFQTAVSSGTLSANAANSRITQELEQLPFRYDSEFMPGFEPGSMMAMMTPGYDKENFRGQKVPLTNPATITDAASGGFEDILQRILGMAGGGGLSGLDSGGGSEMPPFYENPTGAAPPPVSTEGALGSLGAQQSIQDAMGAGNAILQQIKGFLYGNDEPEDDNKMNSFWDLGNGIGGSLNGSWLNDMRKSFRLR
jgi:hypothetical protein